MIPWANKNLLIRTQCRTEKKMYFTLDISTSKAFNTRKKMLIQTMEKIGIRSSHWTKELKDTLQVRGPKTVCHSCPCTFMKLVLNTGILSPGISTASIYSDLSSLLTSQHSSKSFPVQFGFQIVGIHLTERT